MPASAGQHRRARPRVRLDRWALVDLAVALDPASASATDDEARALLCPACRSREMRTVEHLGVLRCGRCDAERTRGWFEARVRHSEDALAALATWSYEADVAAREGDR